MRLSEFIDHVGTLLEAPYSGWVGAMGRPDADYVGRAYKWHPEVEPKDFPYDRDDDGETTAPRFSGFGQGRGQGHDRTLVRPLTAKSKGVTNKSGFEEASGTPMNFTMSGRGGQQLGNPAPGMGGDWAHAGPKPWDDEDDEQFIDTIDTYNEAMLTLPVEAPDVEEPAVVGGDHWEDQTDYDLEKIADRAASGAGAVEDDGVPSEEELTDFNSFPSVLMQVVGSGFGSGLGKTNPSGRGFMTGWTEDYDVLANESIWNKLLQMFAETT